MNPEIVAAALAISQQLIQLAIDAHAGKLDRATAQKALDGITSLHGTLTSQDAAVDVAAAAKFGATP